MNAGPRLANPNAIKRATRARRIGAGALSGPKRSIVNASVDVRRPDAARNARWQAG